LFLLIIVRMAMLFDPLRLFLPASVAMFAGGVALMSYQIAHLRREIKSGR
jgi:hypothetical protein